MGHATFVATAATSQVADHTSKVLAFGLDGFGIGDHLGLIGVGAVGVTIGSWAGTRLLGRIDESQLAALFKVVLTAPALRLTNQAVA